MVFPPSRKRPAGFFLQPTKRDLTAIRESAQDRPMADQYMTKEGKKPAIDTHVHFWDLATYRGYDSWFKGRDYLNKNYLPNDLTPLLAECHVESAIIVGAAPDSHKLNLEWGGLVENNPTVSALIGSYTLENDNLEEWFSDYSGKPWFVGIRAHPSVPPDSWGEPTDADRGLRLLRDRNLTLDILVNHTLLPAVAQFADRIADLPIVVNHCGLPPFPSGDLGNWKSNIQELAKRDNVFMKYSSFFLHCYPHCDNSMLKAAADSLFQSFGVDRLLWGSNWPPELVGGTYREAYNCMLSNAGDLSINEYNQVFRENAEKVYHLPNGVNSVD